MPSSVLCSPTHEADQFSNRLNSLIKSRKSDDLYRSRRIVETPQSAQISTNGNDLLNFCSNDYLGLANDPRVKSACVSGIEKWGVGTGASHLVCGHTGAHHELEEALADFLQRESVLLFSSGYAANVGVINGLLSEGDNIFQDRLNHASLLDGGWISRAKHHWYQHRNYHDLEETIQETIKDAPKNNEGINLIVSDGVFSMDGDECDLKKLIGVSKKHSGSVMIDDAHGIGCIGENGSGIVNPEQFTSADVPILVGTLGKAFGTSGAFVAGDKSLIEFLIQRARNYIYSTAMPSAIAVASLKSLDIIKNESWRREKLQENILYFRDGLSLNNDSEILMPSKIAIQPIVVGSAERANLISQSLEKNGILVSAIRPPTVPNNTSRLRITLTANHSIQEVDRLIEVLSECLS
ncbi:MAG: 8-amino-7-oxononanoate synthase [Cellvibrionaceae bacterium]